MHTIGDSGNGVGVVYDETYTANLIGLNAAKATLSISKETGVLKTIETTDGLSQPCLQYGP